MVVLILVILAAITKSAQMPFSAWLPAAMAAPTPVSALVHSSTLVTAGVYLLIRFNILLGVNNVLFFIGVFTIFISGLGANFETDLKKIIALSTLRQLGLIIIVLSLGFYELSFFHLLSHALFKSLLFLCAGVFIHSMGDIQDIRHLGGVIVSCPVTSFYFVGASLALCGFPFLAGFYSKDAILEVYFISRINSFMYLIVFLSTMFTLTYSVRLVYYIFFKGLGVKSILRIEECLGMSAPMSVLFVLSVLGGGFISWFYFPVVAVIMPISIKLSVLLGLLSLSMVIFSFNNIKILFLVGSYSKLINFIGLMWFLPSLSTFLFMPFIKLGESLVKFFDQGWLEQSGGQGFITKAGRYTSVVDYFIAVDIKRYLLGFFVVIFFSFLCVCLNSLIRAWP